MTEVWSERAQLYRESAAHREGPDLDLLSLSKAAEEAERLRDPSHVRNYTEAEWRSFVEEAGLRVEDVRLFDEPIELEPWLEQTGCEGEEAARVRELLADRIADGRVHLDRIAIKAVKS